MTAAAGRRMWCALLILTTVGVLPGCAGTSGQSAGTAAAEKAAHDRKMKQVEQESERLRKEGARLKAELSASSTEARKGPSPKTSPKTSASTQERSLPAGVSAGMQASFDALAVRLRGSEGVAYTVVGGTAKTQLGSWRTGPGWSTVKVPLAVAADVQAHGRPGAETRRLIERAITASDNAAAERLWSSLGTPRIAASKVQAALRSGGDRVTVVPSRRVRPGFSAFGQTRWSLTHQATFVARLPCLQYGGDVLHLMGAVVSSQRWGIGAVGRPVRFKGGWGPSPSGRYLVRQMGIVTLANGSRIGLAIASEPADGRFETGTANLTALARWVVAHAATQGPGSC